jgi:hypothetical protein
MIISGVCFVILEYSGRQKELGHPILASYRHKGELSRILHTSLVKHASMFTANRKFAVH